MVPNFKVISLDTSKSGSPQGFSESSHIKVSQSMVKSPTRFKVEQPLMVTQSLPQVVDQPLVEGVIVIEGEITSPSTTVVVGSSEEGSPRYDWVDVGPRAFF